MSLGYPPTKILIRVVVLSQNGSNAKSANEVQLSCIIPQQDFVPVSRDELFPDVHGPL